MIGMDGHARRHLHPALRRHPAGAPRPRPGRGGRTARASRVYEHTEVIDIVPGGTGRAPVVRTTAGDGDGGRRRAGRRGLDADPARPASAPWCPSTRSWWPPSRWATSSGQAAGLGDRATFTDYRHMIIYGQRTADDRIAFGGRGRAVPLRVRRATVLRRHAVGAPAPAPDPGRALPRPRVGPLHPRLGRPPRHPPRLAFVGRLRPLTGASPGPGATSATASPPPTWPGGRWPT